MKKIISIFILLIIIMACSGKKEEVKPTVEKKSDTKVINTEKKENKEEIKLNVNEMYGEGLNEEFTTDGNLNEDKFLNKMYGYTDTADRFKIEKVGSEYVITEYIVDLGEQGEKITETKSKLRVYKNVALVNEQGTVIYAYDTKSEQLVFLNSNFKIYLEATDFEE